MVNETNSKHALKILVILPILLKIIRNSAINF